MSCLIGLVIIKIVGFFFWHFTNTSAPNMDISVFIQIINKVTLDSKLYSNQNDSKLYGVNYNLLYIINSVNDMLKLQIFHTHTHVLLYRV